MIVIVLMADVVVVAVIVIVIVIVAVIVIVRMPALIVIVIAIAIMVMIMVVIMLLKGGFQVLGKSLFGSAIDFSNGDSSFGGDLRARFKFRCEQRAFAVTPAELAMQLADRSFNDARLPSTLRALH